MSGLPPAAKRARLDSLASSGRARTTSFSRRMRSASELYDENIIDAAQKSALKDILLQGSDERVSAAVDAWSAGNTQPIRDLVSSGYFAASAAAKSSGIDLGLSLAMDFPTLGLGKQGAAGTGASSSSSSSSRFRGMSTASHSEMDGGLGGLPGGPSTRSRLFSLASLGGGSSGGATGGVSQPPAPPDDVPVQPMDSVLAQSLLSSLPHELQQEALGQPGGGLVGAGAAAAGMPTPASHATAAVGGAAPAHTGAAAAAAGGLLNGASSVPSGGATGLPGGRTARGVSMSAAAGLPGLSAHAGASRGGASRLTLGSFDLYGLGPAGTGAGVAAATNMMALDGPAAPSPGLVGLAAPPNAGLGGASSGAIGRPDFRLPSPYLGGLASVGGPGGVASAALGGRGGMGDSSAGISRFRLQSDAGDGSGALFGLMGSPHGLPSSSLAAAPSSGGAAAPAATTSVASLAGAAPAPASPASAGVMLPGSFVYGPSGRGGLRARQSSADYYYSGVGGTGDSSSSVGSGVGASLLLGMIGGPAAAVVPGLPGSVGLPGGPARRSGRLAAAAAAAAAAEDEEEEEDATHGPTTAVAGLGPTAYGLGPDGLPPAFGGAALHGAAAGADAGVGGDFDEDEGDDIEGDEDDDDDDDLMTGSGLAGRMAGGRLRGGRGMLTTAGRAGAAAARGAHSHAAHAAGGAGGAAPGHGQHPALGWTGSQDDGGAGAAASRGGGVSSGGAGGAARSGRGVASGAAVAAAVPAAASAAASSSSSSGLATSSGSGGSSRIAAAAQKKASSGGGSGFGGSRSGGAGGGGGAGGAGGHTQLTGKEPLTDAEIAAAPPATGDGTILPTMRIITVQNVDVPYPVYLPGNIGMYSVPARVRRIERYMAKREGRIWHKNIKYDVRKAFADSRLRVKGRFVKKEDEAVLREFLSVIL